MPDEDLLIKLLLDLKLTISQFFGLWLINARRNDLIDDYNKVIGNLLTEAEQQDLIKRGFVATNSGGYKITEAFTRIFYDKELAARAIWAEYPYQVIGKDGTMYPLKGMPYYKFANNYFGEHYKGIQAEHDEILADIKFANSKGYIRTSIEKFFLSYAYRDIRRIRKSEVLDKSSINTISRLNEF